MERTGTSTASDLYQCVSAPCPEQRYHPSLYCYSGKYGVDPALTELELTETATVSDYDHVNSCLSKLRTVGFRTALDDFGAGYSVLNTVIDIPVNTVKVDRAFIK